MSTPGAGVLYVVATPIGNLADTSTRMLEVLGSVDRIAAEDTRRTGRFLAAHGIEGRLESCHDHNEARKAPRLVEELVAGSSLALVTDAGTPGVSDPAYHLVRLAIDAGVRVVAVPGPSAVLTALVLSGLPMDRFVFEGFPPRRPGPLRRRLEELAELPHTLVFFETPPRLPALVRAAAATLGDRPVAIGRELTKLHEEVWRGTLEGWLAAAGDRRLRGELTVVIAGATRHWRRAQRRRGGEAPA
ncbi:MAG: 16S rRNA (cytidine(1402)-2'-O)-methyltransferase [Candidatus Eiseniibacteriota bacterium]